MNKHKKQIFWQIYLPMVVIIGLLVFFTFSFFGKTMLGEMDLRIWSDISLLVITLPLLFICVVFFIHLILIIYLISRYRSTVSYILLYIGDILIITSHWTSKITGFLSSPIIQIESFISQILPHRRGD